MDDAARWQAVLERDSGHDGSFVYAVRSTGIYCRPSCPSRRPRREHVQFFAQPGEAEQASFRPCRRCHPREAAPPLAHAELVGRVCRLLEQRSDSPPDLAELGAQVGLSPAHLQRLFKRATGVSPRQYAAACRLDQFKAALRDGMDVTAALYSVGYGSSSRVYGQAPAPLGMTPAAYRRRGHGMQIAYAVAASPLGRLLVASTARGICAVCLGGDDGALEAELRGEYPAATIARDEAGLGQAVAAIVQHLEGQRPHLDLPLDIQATAFQWRVWQALRAIPYGSTRSYGEVAAAIGQPGAARAVASACAANRAALLIPCHRVVREGGDLGGYRWGAERKRQLIEREAEG